MSQSSVRAIIFDVDGVLFHSQNAAGHYLWSQTITQDLGLSGRHFKKIFSHAWQAVIRGHLTLQSHLAQVWQDPLFSCLTLTPKDYIDYWLDHDQHLNQQMLDLVKRLPLPCYLGTNQEQQRTQRIMNTIGGLFQACFSSYAIGFAKPEPQFFQHIEKTLRLSPQQLLFIDDMPNYVKGARERGWCCYHYQQDFANLIDFLGKHGILI